MTAMIDTAQRIKELNDAFRRTGHGGRILFTAGVSELRRCLLAPGACPCAALRRFHGRQRPPRGA